MTKSNFPYVALALLAALPVSVSAQATVLGVTATQAVLHYQASAGTVCQVQVSQSRTYSPPAADVDPALFPAANLDSRAGSISSQSGTDRYFVIGKRRADQASDGKRYSRALQAFTEYFYQVTCGAAVQNGRFVTANPPLGNNFPEPPPFDASGFGNYAWPTIDWNDQSKSYIDPMTGILLKRATAPGWYGQTETGKPFGYAIDLNNTWSNAANILSGNNSTRATYTGLGGDPIFVAISAASQLRGFGGNGLGNWYPSQTLDNIMVRIFGAGNATISGCLSNDSGAHCASPAVDMVTLGASGGNPAGTFPPACGAESATGCFPNNGFWGGWNLTPISGQISAGSGTVNVAGSAVTPGPYSGFDVNWKPGGKVFIAGSAPACLNNLCTIASVNSSGSLTIFENAGTLNAVQFQTANSGVILWVRKTTGTSTASISVNFDYAYSDQFTMPLNGTTAQCSPNLTTVSFAADGATPIAPVPGELCLASHQSGPGYVLYLMIPSTGETRLLAPVWNVNASDPQADQVADGGNFHMLGAGFDATDPNTVYAQVNTIGGVSVFKGVYNAAQYKYKTYYHSFYPSRTALYSPGQDTTQYWYRGPAWGDTGIAWTNMTKASQGKDLGSQIAASDPNWDPNIFGAPGITEVANGRAFTTNVVADYGETLNLIHSFDLATGNLVQSTTTWSSFPARWCAIHSNIVLEGWYGLICNPLGGTYSFTGKTNVVGIGPWQMTPTAVLKNGSFNSDTSMTANSPRDACTDIPPYLAPFVPANPGCVTFQSQMACSHTPHAGENTKWPCEYNPDWSELQPIAAGDGLLVMNGTNNVETLLVVSVTSLGNARYQFTAVRGSTASGSKSTPTGWAAYAVPPSTNCDPTQCTPGVGMWFDSKASSVTWRLDPGAFSGHSDLGNGPTAGGNSYCVTFACRYNTPMSQQIGTGFSISVLPGSFAGVSGSVALQGYPSIHQVTAPPQEKVWMLNFRHLNPSTGVGPEIATDVGGVSYSPVPATKSVFKFTNVNGGLSYKQVPVVGYAGYHLLRDVSSPATGNIITDSTPWQFCVVQKAGECQAGSTPGEAYASVPSGSVRGSQNCVSNSYDDNFPCLFTPPAAAAFGIQQGISRPDLAGSYWRRITMGLSGPGRQFQFASFIPDPTGAWAFIQGFWVDGARNDLFMAKLPPWPNPQDVTTNRSNFIQQSISVTANANLPGARIRFGYSENGLPTNFYCTARQEGCVTGGVPYSFLSENPSWQSCGNGCTIPVPAIPGRVLFYAVDRRDVSGNIVSGDPQVVVVP